MGKAGAMNVDERRIRFAAEIMDPQRNQIFARATFALYQQRAAGLREFSGLFEQPQRSGISRYVLGQYRRCFCRHTRQEDFLFFLPPAFFFAIVRELLLAALRGPALVLLFAERALAAFFVLPA